MSRRKKPFPFFLWHRRLGLAALALVFILSITGIMLNHTESLKLNETVVESDMVLNWYGINPSGTPVNFSSGDIWISQWNQQIFFNGETLFTHNKPLLGITLLNDMIAIALGNDILLIDSEGEVIELMQSASHSSVVKMGLLENKIFLLDQKGNFYLSDSQLSRWIKQTENFLPDPIKLQAVKTQLNAIQIQKLKTAYRGPGLRMERVILDLHSGRIFNDSWGIYIMDLSAVAMMLLGISGMWVWWSRKLKLRKKKHYQKHHKIYYDSHSKKTTLFELTCFL